MRLLRFLEQTSQEHAEFLDWLGAVFLWTGAYGTSPDKMSPAQRSELEAKLLRYRHYAEPFSDAMGKTVHRGIQLPPEYAEAGRRKETFEIPSQWKLGSFTYFKSTALGFSDTMGMSDVKDGERVIISYPTTQVDIYLNVTSLLVALSEGQISDIGKHEEVFDNFSAIAADEAEVIVVNPASYVVGPKNFSSPRNVRQTDYHATESKVFEARPMVGYKVMNHDPRTGTLTSGRDARQKFPLKKGYTMQMPGNGIYMSLGKEYVLTYYSGLAENEVLIEFAFDPDDILFGNLTDRETEFAVSKATINDFEVLESDEEFDEGMDGGNFLTKDLPSGPTIYPVPRGSREYEDIDSPKRGGTKVKVRGNKTA